jgi:hypothetical protein
MNLAQNFRLFYPTHPKITHFAYKKIHVSNPINTALWRYYEGKRTKGSSTMKSNKPKLDREKIWQIIEAIVIFVATWLNPQATIGILGLKLCFHILKILRQPPK